MPTLIVKAKELRYGGKTYLHGASFECAEKDVRILKAVGKAADPDQKSPLRVADPQPPRATQRRDLLSEGGEQSEKPARRRYGRRDMTSED
jgi:hypothetical protein